MPRKILLTLLAIFGCASSHGQQPDSGTTPAPTPATPPANKESFHIYLLMGQSNMAGRDIRQLASQVDNPQVLALDMDGKWIVARDPLHPPQGRTVPGAGPGIPFALAMLKAEQKITIGLIPRSEERRVGKECA